MKKIKEKFKYTTSKKTIVMKLKRIKTITTKKNKVTKKERKNKNKQKKSEKTIKTTIEERKIEHKKVTKNKKTEEKKEKTEEKKEGKNESKDTEETKENNISILKRTTILFIDYMILSIISMKLLFYTQNLYKTQSSFTEIFLYLNLLGLIAFFYSMYFLKVYNATPGMMLMNVKLNVLNKNNINKNNKEENLSIIKYSLLYYSIFLSSLIVIIELLSQLFLKNTTMFEIISKTKLSE